MRTIALAVAAALLLPVGTARGHGDTTEAKHPVDKAEQTAFGRAGDPKAATRTVRIAMDDTMRFLPPTLTFKQGETVRLVVRNNGNTLHELVLGTADELARHAELMRKFPGMEHDEPYMAHVSPGHTQEIVWTFNRPGKFRFACLVAGHYEAGMTGNIIVK